LLCSAVAEVINQSALTTDDKNQDG